MQNDMEYMMKSMESTMTNMQRDLKDLKHQLQKISSICPTEMVLPLTHRESIGLDNSLWEEPVQPSPFPSAILTNIVQLTTIPLPNLVTQCNQ